MAQDPRADPEEFDLRLEWPRDGLIEPLDRSATRSGEHPDGSDAEPDRSGDQDAELEAETPEVADEDPVDSLESERAAVLRVLEPSVTDLVAGYEALVSTMSTFRDVVSGHLHTYVDEVGLMETVSSGYLRQYRDAHVRALTDLRHVVGDNPAWVQWLADSVREMATAVDDATQGVRELGDDARQSVTRSDDAVGRMADAVRWLGEQLQSSLSELRSVVVPENTDGDAGALVQSSVAVDRALTKLAETREGGPAGMAGDRDDASFRTVLGDPRIEKELSRLADEVRTSRALDEVLLEDLAAKIAEQQQGGGDDRVRAEVGRLADELQSLRRRLNLRAKTPATLDQDQIDAIADAVVAALGGVAPARTPRRRPLEARRTPGTQTRRPRD
jgi:HAMP domain-containing protein